MRISIIIPTLNEEKRIQGLVNHLREDPSSNLVKEIVVVDGNSRDNTVAMATEVGVRVIQCKQSSRSVQMNLGASHARADILYFLHADTIPPQWYARDICQSVEDGNVAGCFRLKFDLDHWLLNMSGWCTRFKSPHLRFGDQSLFVTKQVFDTLQGFSEDLRLFEDQELVKRCIKQGPFRVMSNHVITSSRKYRKNGVMRLQLVYGWIFLLYTLGFSQEVLMQTYKQLTTDPML